MTTPSRSTPSEVPAGHDRSGRRALRAGTAVLLVALGAGLFLAARRSAVYPAGSPEAAAQGYLQALFDADWRAARGYLAPELVLGCRTGEPQSWWVASSGSVRFADVGVVGDRSEIDLELASRDLTDFWYDPFDPGYDPARDAELFLERRDGVWVITEAAEPLHSCDRR